MSFLNRLKRRSAIVILVIQACAWFAGNASGSLLPQLGWSRNNIAEALGVGLLASVIVTAWQIVQGDHVTEQELKRLTFELSQRNRELSEAVIQTLLEQLAQLLGKAELATRCNVFIADKDSKLRIVYHHGMADAPDRNICLEKFQGCTGHAFGMGLQTVADLTKVPAEELIRTWKLTPEQIRLTEHIGSILSTPIKGEAGRRTVGVLSIDSSGTLLESGLDEQQAMDTALQAAEALAQLLQMSGDMMDSEGGEDSGI